MLVDSTRLVTLPLLLLTAAGNDVVQMVAAHPDRSISNTHNVPLYCHTVVHCIHQSCHASKTSFKTLTKQNTGSTRKTNSKCPDWS